MSRRTGLPWAPTSLPPLRTQWCHVLGEGLEQLRGQASGGELAAQAQEDLAGLAASALFWVSRDMTDLATSAAETLPEWSPAAAIPERYGLMCFAKPAGVFDWPVPGGTQRIPMPVDAALWGVRNGSVAVSCAFRTERIAGQLNPGLARLPMISHPVGMWHVDEPVAHRLDSGAVAPLAVLGSCWLLMEQPTVTQTRRIGGAAVGSSGVAEVEAGESGGVSIIELRRIRASDGAGAEANSGGRYHDKRWWVSGHWRQQAYGPGRKLRKPVWISPFLKGPEDAPLADTTRVYAWRR